MSMRLLQKRDIDKVKATEAKRGIDEGLKLARQVDTLREVAAQEEQSLLKFRVKTVAKINEEITQKTRERDELEAGNAQKRSERAELEKPLDDAWAKVNEKDASLDAYRETLAIRDVDLKDKENKASAYLAGSNRALAKATTKEEAAANAYADADALRVEAKDALVLASKVKEEAETMKKQVVAELIHRDMEMAARERGVTMREVNLKGRDAELANEWILLKDRQAMLERNFNRIK